MRGFSKVNAQLSDDIHESGHTICNTFIFSYISLIPGTVDTTDQVFIYEQRRIICRNVNFCLQHYICSSVS